MTTKQERIRRNNFVYNATNQPRVCSVSDYYILNDGVKLRLFVLKKHPGAAVQFFQCTITSRVGTSRSDSHGCLNKYIEVLDPNPNSFQKDTWFNNCTTSV